MPMQVKIEILLILFSKIKGDFSCLTKPRFRYWTMGRSLFAGTSIWSMRRETRFLPKNKSPYAVAVYPKTSPFAMGRIEGTSKIILAQKNSFPSSIHTLWSSSPFQRGAFHFAHFWTKVFVFRIKWTIPGFGGMRDG
jgi:hypothetical protein